MSNTAAQESPEPRLEQLFSEPGASLEKCEASVVVIPDFDVPTVRSWQDGWHNCWLQTRLPASVLNPCVLSFEPGLKINDGFTWQKVVEYGDLLLSQLLHRDKCDAGFRERPLFFVAHGLAGFILKRTIGVLFERFFDAAYRGIIAATTGIVFLGCPSPASHKPRDLERLLLMLKAISKHASKTKSAQGNSSIITANIAQKFSDAGVESPVLSVYETKVSKVGKNIFAPRQLLVDKQFCETMTRRERLIGIDCTHEELCNFNTTSSLEREITAFFSLALDMKKMMSEVVPSYARQSNSSRTPTFSDIREVQVRIENASMADTSRSTNNSIYASTDESYVRLPSISSSVSSSRRAAKLPCYILPPHERNPEFAGRKDTLRMLDKALLPSSNSTPSTQNRLKTFALCGIGGVGKTQIAVEFVYSRMKEFNAVFWVHAADAGKLSNDYVNIATELGLEEVDKAPDSAVARNVVLQWLSCPVEAGYRSTEDLSLSTTKWLMIYDNVESLADLRDFWPIGGNGSILITSRDPLAKTQTYFHSSEGVDVEPFETGDCASWLRKLTNYNKTPEDIELSEVIAEKLSNLPLAISQIAGAILRQNLTFSEFLDYYKQESFRAQIYQSDYKHMQRPIWTTFAFEGLSAEAAALLNVICFLDPDSIHESLFTSLIGTAEAGKIKLAGFPTKSIEYVVARTQLTKSSLVRRTVGSKGITVHRIVQDSAMGRMEPKVLLSAFGTSLRLLSIAWPSTNVQDWSHERGKISAPLVPHIHHLMTQYDMSQTLQETYDHNNEFGRLLAEAAWYLIETGNPEDSLKFLQLAQTLLENAPDMDDLALAYTYQVQAQAANLTTQIDMCLSKAKMSLEILQKIDFSNHMEHFNALPRAHNELCEALIMGRNYEEAMAPANTAIELLKTHLPSHYPIFAVCNKAFLLWRQGGQAESREASKLLEEALAWQKKSFGEGHVAFKTAIVTAGLGDICTAQRRFNDGLELHTKAHDIYLETLGRNHYRVAAIVAKIAIHYHRKGDLVKAKEMLLESLAIYGNRSYLAAEITWTSFLLVRVLEELKDPIADETRKSAQYELLELSMKLGRRLDERDLEECLASWAQ